MRIWDKLLLIEGVLFFLEQEAHRSITGANYGCASIINTEPIALGHLALIVFMPPLEFE